VYIEARGIGGTSQGTLFLEVLKCFYPAEGQFGTYTGTFTMSKNNGKDSVTGTYSGQNDSAGDLYGYAPFSGVLTVTRGTGKFHDAAGRGRFTAVSGPFASGPLSLPGSAPTSNVALLMAFYSIEGTLELRGDK
ncbi:MAG: hypothetical protein JO356_08585, partial [Acidobacteria bacterium]|nr:hypothetical protein [Acidobacteriota bacterium]